MYAVNTADGLVMKLQVRASFIQLKARRHLGTLMRERDSGTREQ